MQGKPQPTQWTMEFHRPRPEIFRLHQFLARVGLRGYISIKLTDPLIQKNNWSPLLILYIGLLTYIDGVSTDFEINLHSVVSAIRCSASFCSLSVTGNRVAELPTHTPAYMYSDGWSFTFIPIILSILIPMFHLIHWNTILYIQEKSFIIELDYL